MQVFNLFSFVSVFIVFGFLPIFLILFYLKLDKVTSAIFSIGYAPVFISFINIIVVTLGIENSILKYSIPLTILALEIFLLKKKNISLHEILNVKKLIKPFFIGILFGIGFWLVEFHIYEDQVKMYADVIWNLGFVNELKHHFPPVDPHWFTGKIFIYHYLSNIYIAGISNFTGLNVVTTMKLVNFATAVSIFVILSLSVKAKSAFENLVLFVLVLFLNLSNRWINGYSLFSHISVWAASTFFWSLPVFITSIYFWMKLEEKRSEFNHVLLMILISFQVVILFFSKSSFLLVFIFLEFYAFIHKLTKVPFQRSDWFRESIKLALKYIYYPLFLIIILIVLPSGMDTLTPGFEIRDFQVFQSWNPLFPFISIFAVSIIILVLSYRFLKNFRWEFLFASFVNFVLFFILKHPGYSDCYFIYNAVFLIAFFLCYSDFSMKAVKFLTAYMLCGVILMCFSKIDVIEGFTPLEYKTDLSNFLQPVDTLYLEEVEDCLALSEKLPDNCLIAAPKNADSRFFMYSALIGRRIWNENNLYVNSTVNEYSLSETFQKKEGFIPGYMKRKPLIQDYDTAYSKYINSLKIEDFPNLENSEKRYEIYNKFISVSQSDQECEELIRKYKWTHVIIRNDQLASINNWLKSREKIEGKSITIIKI
jgi:hypothetical protein